MHDESNFLGLIRGWQSPLFIDSGPDGPTRHFFANELLKAHANDDHPLVRPWTDEIIRDLNARGREQHRHPRRDDDRRQMGATAPSHFVRQVSYSTEVRSVRHACPEGA